MKVVLLDCDFLVQFNFDLVNVNWFWWGNIAKSFLHKLLNAYQKYYKKVSIKPNMHVSKDVLRSHEAKVIFLCTFGKKFTQNLLNYCQ